MTNNIIPFSRGFDRATLVSWLNYGAIAGRDDLTGALILGDDTIVSVQAGKYKYSTPQRAVTDSYSIYSELEVGFPSKKIDELMPYCENPEDPTGTIL